MQNGEKEEVCLLYAVVLASTSITISSDGQDVISLRSQVTPHAPYIHHLRLHISHCTLYNRLISFDAFSRLAYLPTVFLYKYIHKAELSALLLSVKK